MVRKRARPRALSRSKYPVSTGAAKATGDMATLDSTTATALQPSGVEPDVTAQRVVRDSFTMPLADYALIGSLKVKCLGMGIAVKKSELLRAGLHALTRISDQNFAEVVSAVESVKTGRPPGKKRKKSKRAKVTR
jgi:hypothetical protein